MKIRIALFAAARHLTGEREIEVELAQSPICVKDLRLVIAEMHPEIRQLVSASALAIDHEYAADDDWVSEHSEVALIPPVSGG